MARDPDTLEERSSTEESTAHAQAPAMEFAEGPSRAERTVSRQRRTTPLWPWLVLFALFVAGFLIWAAVS